jgi:predicted Zn-dependent protease
MRVPPTLLAVLLALSATRCVRSNYNLATQQEEYTITSTQKEINMGRVLARHVHKELEMVEDDTVQTRVRTIGRRVAAVCDRQELLYEFHVVHDEDVNAFSLPGGFVFVNDGLLKKTTSDDEVAAVLAHEIAHIAARHAVKRYETSLGAQLVQMASMAAQSGQLARGLGIAMQATRLAYARDDELEADRLGVKYLKAAGFDPTAALRMLDHLREENAAHTHYLPRGITRPQYAQTHPYVPERLRAVKEALYGVADYIDYLNTTQ